MKKRQWIKFLKKVFYFFEKKENGKKKKYDLLKKIFLPFG